MAELIPNVLTRVGDAVNKRPVGWQRPECGLSATERWVVQLEDGTSAFVKAATDISTSDWLVNERDSLEVAGPQFAPAIIAWLDDEYPVLVTEDMSAGYWPAGTGEVHWRDGDMDAVIASLDQLRAIQPGNQLSHVQEPLPVWNDLLANPALGRSGLCTSRWIEKYGTDIITAEQISNPVGMSLVHGDVRSDNLCLYQGGHVRFVDWAHSGFGHPYHDLVVLLPTLRLEGGPRPSVVLSDHVGLIVRSAGTSITRALGDESGPDWLRAVMLRLAAINLEWVSDILELAPPDGVSEHVPCLE